MHRALLVAAVAALMLPAGAEAKTFRGKTSQGRSASVVTGADGVPTRVRISYRAKCADGHNVTGKTNFQPPFDAVNATSISDGGTENVTSSTRKGESARITSKLTGTFAGSRWRGTYRVKLT